MKVTTFYAQVAGYRLKVQKMTVDISASDKNKPTMVFLHEGLGCIELWKDFPQRLCRAVGLNGLVYDRKGYGGSDSYKRLWPKDYLIDEATIDLPELLTSCDIEKTILIGHSDGGSIALLAAATQQSLVKGTITEAAHIFVENETVSGIQKFMHAYDSENLLKEKLSRYHGKNTDTVVRRWAHTWLASDFRDWNIESFLPKISCPLLVLQGATDEYATIKQVKGIVGQVSGPVSCRIISECGHTPHIQSADQVLEIMSDFIMHLLQEGKMIHVK